jgi:hypothetical protein
MYNGEKIMGELTLLFSKLLETEMLKLSDDQYNKIKNLYNKTHFKIADSNGCEISLNHKILNDKNLIFLKKIVLNSFLNFNKKYLKYNNNFKITTSWFTHTKKDNSSEYHNHTNSFFSGVFYFSENCSPIKFINFNKNNSFGLEPIEYNIFNSTSWSISPAKGTLLLFPSELHHCITRSYNNRESLAFNIVPYGEYGMGDSIVNVNYN